VNAIVKIREIVDMNAIMETETQLSVLTCKAITRTSDFYMRSNSMMRRVVTISLNYHVRYEYVVLEAKSYQISVINSLFIVHCLLCAFICS